MVIQEIQGQTNRAVLRMDLRTVDGAANEILDLLIAHALDMSVTHAGEGWVVSATIHHSLWPRIAAAGAGVMDLHTSQTGKEHMLTYSMHRRDMTTDTAAKYMAIGGSL